MADTNTIVQCAKCPWRKSTDPSTIPNGYCAKKHAALESTIARDGRMFGKLHMMACHESPVGHEVPCAGWLENQLGVGNNIALRLLAIEGRVPSFRTSGAQHLRFEDTLPTRQVRRRRHG